MMQTETPVVWQRVPQGWIELAAFANDDIAERWWQAYLAPAIGSVDSDTIALMTRAFASEAARSLPPEARFTRRIQPPFCARPRRRRATEVAPWRNFRAA